MTGDFPEAKMADESFLHDAVINALENGGSALSLAEIMAVTGAKSQAELEEVIQDLSRASIVQCKEGEDSVWELVPGSSGKHQDEEMQWNGEGEYFHEVLIDPWVDEDLIDPYGTLTDQIMDVLRASPGCFTIRGIMENVIMCTTYRDIEECLGMLQDQSLVVKKGDDPPRWKAMRGHYPANEGLPGQDSVMPPQQQSDLEAPMNMGKEEEEVSPPPVAPPANSNPQALMAQPTAPLMTQPTALPVVPPLMGHQPPRPNIPFRPPVLRPVQPVESFRPQLPGPVPGRQLPPGRGRSRGCPPPPTAALFQSLMSQCSRPPAPVVQAGGGVGRIRPPVPTTPHQTRPLFPPPDRAPGPPVPLLSGPQFRPSTPVPGTPQQNQNPGTNPGLRFAGRGRGMLGAMEKNRPGSREGSSKFGLQANKAPTPSPGGYKVDRNEAPMRIDDHNTRNLPSSSQSLSKPQPLMNQSMAHAAPPLMSKPAFIPAPPSALMFQNLVSRGPQKIPTRKPGGGSGPNISAKNLNPHESRVLDFMKQEGKPCDTLQIARSVGCSTKKEVNPTLYHLQSLGFIIKMHDHPPTWRVRKETTALDISLEIAEREYDGPEEEEGGDNGPQGHYLPQKRHHPSHDFTRNAGSYSGNSQFKRLEQDEPRGVGQGHAPRLSAIPASPRPENPRPLLQGSTWQPMRTNTPQELPPGLRPLPRANLPPPPRPPSFQLPRNSPVPLMQTALSRETYAAFNKNPVSALNEYAQKNQMEVTFETISERGANKSVVARVGGTTYPPVSARNMKDARREAADLALRTIVGQNMSGPGSTSELSFLQPQASNFKGVRTHFDMIAALSHHAFMQIAASIPDKFAGRKVVACIVMKRNPEDSGHVVSLGAGNRCVTGQRLSMEGKVVNDSHAEIVARRSLLRFFYQQLHSCLDGNDSIFYQRYENAANLSVRDGVSFHLYISTAPCGDGALFTPREGANNDISDCAREHTPTFTNKQQGIIRTKIEDGEGTIPIDPADGPQTWDGLLQGGRLRTMSCSDKICRWNAVGLQGALLSHFIEPVYLESLTLGYLYDHGHLSRATCCRLQNKVDLGTELVSPFRVNHPWLGRVTAYDPPRETEKTNNMSVNWMRDDKCAEVTDGRTGACLSRTNNSPTPSRLCKLALYQSFKELCARAGRMELLEAETYRDAKQMAVDFQNAKKSLFECFKRARYGSWVSKPMEQELF